VPIPTYPLAEMRIFSEFPPVELLVLNIKAPAVVLAAAFSQIAPICAAETMEVPIIVWSLKEIRLPKLLATVPVESLSMVKLLCKSLVPLSELDIFNLDIGLVVPMPT